MSTVKTAQSPGRRTRTTRAEVVAAAVAIVDAEGVEALTIRRLAAACGLSPMGIYRYVRNRNELLDSVVEHILEELPTDAPTGTWQEKAAQIFGGFRTMALAHPGVTTLGVTRVSPVPSMARFTDQALAIMEEAGLVGDEAVLAYDALLMFTVGSVLWQLPRTGTERHTLLQAAAADDQPATHLIRHARELGNREPDRYYAHGLQTLLAGLESKTSSAKRKARTTTR